MLFYSPTSITFDLVHPRAAKAVQLLDLFEERGSKIDLDTILPLGNDDWIDGLHKIIPPNIEFADDQWGAFNEAGFYPAFGSDLETARESIVIYSPYVTNRGVTRWTDHIRAALETRRSGSHCGQARKGVGRGIRGRG